MQYFSKILILFLLSLTACIDTMDLPTMPETIGVINQGAENYIEILPRWDKNILGTSNFNDLFIAQDGRLFIADSSMSSIHVYRESGQKADAIYDILKNPIINNKIIHPTSVCVNSKFMVFFSDGQNKIYAWNYLLAHSEVVAIIDSFDITNGEEIKTITPKQIFQMDSSYSIIEGSEQINNSVEAIEELSKLYTFYDPSDMINREINAVYADVDKEFISIAPGEKKYMPLPPEEYESSHIFATDRKNNRIVKINLVLDKLVVLENGDVLFTYNKGIFDSFVASPGTGIGTVSKPTGLTSDKNGDIFYSQLGDYFSVHRLSGTDFSSIYTLGDHDIMDLDQFSSAMDLTIDDNGSIFVVDSSLRLVKKFNPNGSFATLLAVEKTWVKQQDTIFTIVGNDTTINYKDILVQYIEANILNHPTVITEYNGVVYIGDTGNNRILRYTLADDINIEGPVN